MSKKIDAQLVINGINNTNKAFNEVDANLNNLSALAKKAGIALAASLSVAAVAGWVKGSIDAADAARKNAQAVGLAVEEYTALEYAAKLAGVETTSLNGAMSRLNRALAEAAAGVARPAEAFRQLGIEIRDSAGALKTSDRILAEVADRFQEMPDGVAKSAAAMELFGRSGTQLIPLLNGGAEGLEELRKEAEALGIVISADTAAKAEVFNDNLTRIGAAATGVGNKVSADLLPSLESLSALIVDVNKNTEASSVIATTLSGGMKVLATLVMAVGTAFVFVGNIIGAQMAAINALLRGEVRQAGDVLKMLAEDNLKLLEDTGARISKLYSEAGEAAAKAQVEQKKIQLDAEAAAEARVAVVERQQKQIVDATKARIKELQAAERAANGDLKRVRDERLKIEQRYQEAIAGLGGQGEASYGGAQSLKVGAQKALKDGDIESAKAQAQAALKMLQDLAAAGESTYGFEGFIRELEAIELAANDIEDQALRDKLTGIQVSIADLTEKAKDLEKMPVSVAVDEASIAAAQTAIQRLASELGEKLVIPVTVSANATAPDVPGFARGTKNAPPGMAWVGEQGPELVVFGGGEQVLTAAASQNLMQTMSGMNLSSFGGAGLSEAAAAVQPSGPGRDLGRVELALPGGEKLSLLADGENFDRIVRRTAMKRGRTRVN